MKFLKWLRKFIDKVLFRKNKEKQVIETNNFIIATEEEVRIKINQLVTNETEPSKDEIADVAMMKTVNEVQKIIKEIETSKRKKVFDLDEIKKELGILNEKLIDIQIKQNRNKPIIFTQNNSIDNDLEELERIVNKYDNKKNLLISNSEIDNLKNKFKQFGKFFQENELVKTYRIREEKRKVEEETKKQQVKQLIGQIEILINNNNLQEASKLLPTARISIKGLRNANDKKNLQKKYETQYTNFRNKQILEEAKRQADKLKIEQKEAEQRRLEEVARREEEQKKREQQELLYRREEEEKRKKEVDKKQQLQRLISKKSDWQKFEQVLKENGIVKLYHFTDRANIASIKKNKGLFSWRYCDINDILISKSGGSPFSRGLDTQYSLQDFVRLSFCDDHPMQFRLLNSGYNLVVLEVEIGVAFFENTRFSNINATDNNHKQGSKLEDLQRVNFAATKKKYVRKEDPDFKFLQAEVMVKTWIPIEYITNINQF